MRCSCLSFWVAIKHWHLLERDIPNFGQSMVLLATSTTAQGVRMVEVWFLSDFYQFQKVCFSSESSHIQNFVLANHEHAKCPEFRQFRQKLFHSSLSFILETLRHGVTIPEVYQCLDGYYRRIIWGIGPYLGDYPEQVLLGCIVQGWCAL